MTRSVPLLRLWPLALAALGGCRTPPPAEPPPPVAATAASAPATVAAPASASPARPTLLDEQRRLSALFRGTPVVFTMQSASSLRVDVPRRFCFDPGQATPKPALIAVIDRLAQSQHDAVSRIVVSAAGDAPAKPAASASAASAARRPAKPPIAVLGTRRAASVRDRFASQGIEAGRLGLADSDTAGVTVVIRESAAP